MHSGDTLASARAEGCGPRPWVPVPGWVQRWQDTHLLMARLLHLCKTRVMPACPPPQGSTSLGDGCRLYVSLLRPLSDEQAESGTEGGDLSLTCVSPSPPPLKPGVSDTLTQCNLIVCDLWSQQKEYQHLHPGNKSKFGHGCKH